MPAYKNQHFVPRCLLRPFTFNSEGRAINLYSFPKHLLINAAPVRSQCARDYIYGHDGAIEAELATIEGNYVAAFNRVEGGSNTGDDLQLLRFFAYLQLRRTEMAMMRLRASQEGLFAEVFGHDEPERPPQRYYMVQSMQTCFETSHMISDLKVKIIENDTSVEFVISDDPATLTNKYATQKLQKVGFGTMNSGLILSMPLSPKLAVICYDGLVYTLPGVGDRLKIKDDKDAEAINGLQYLSAASNIYFSEWEKGEYVRRQFAAWAPSRVDDFAVFNHLILSESDERGDIYVKCTREEAQRATKSLIHQEFRHPTPSRWLSNIKYRDPIQTFSDGTGAGHVRKVEWLRRIN